MRLIRGAVNALLVATLVKPVSRLVIGRWRRRARDLADEALGVPAREVIEAALLETMLTTDDVAAEPDTATMEDLEAVAGRSALRTLLIVGALVTIGAGVAYAIVVVRRRRMAAAELEVESDRVAIPIDVDAEEREEAPSSTQEPATPTT